MIDTYVWEILKVEIIKDDNRKDIKAKMKKFWNWQFKKNVFERIQRI